MASETQIEMDPIDARLHHPYSWLIAGPSKSGKTTFVSKLMNYYDLLLGKRPDYVVLYYANMQPIYTHMFNRGWISEMININENPIDIHELENKLRLHKYNNGSLVIFDDALLKVDAKFAEIYTRIGHHTNSSLIFLTQSFFYDNKNYRIISLQQDYVTLMPFKKDQLQIRNIARQLCPGNFNKLISYYNQATQEQGGYLFIDSSANANKKIILRTRMFPTEIPCIVYNL